MLSFSTDSLNQAFQAAAKSLTVFVLFALTPSGYAGKVSDKTVYYRVSFYDDNLDFNASIKVKANDAINIASLIKKLDLNSTLYSANASVPIRAGVYTVTKDINFYAIPNVTEITDQNGLAAIDINASRPNGKYILLNDIHLDENGAGFEKDLGWKPIGDLPIIYGDMDDEQYYFEGVFNGNNHKITGLWINRGSNYNIGLFGAIVSTTIKNLGVEIKDGKKVKGRYAVGAIAGNVFHSLIINSYSTGSVSEIEDKDFSAANEDEAQDEDDADQEPEGSIGGIAGHVNNGAIINSYSTANVNATSVFVGGIAGELSFNSEIINSYATGNISGAYEVGGVAGWASFGSKIINSYATGNISGINSVGGVAGSASVFAKITNSYSTGSVSGQNNVGGVAGKVGDGSAIENNAAINPSITGGINVNRVAGYINNADRQNKIANNFALNEMRIKGNGGAIGTLKSKTALKTRATYETDLNWSFGLNANAPWQIDANKNDGYPYLYWRYR